MISVKLQMKTMKMKTKRKTCMKKVAHAITVVNKSTYDTLKILCLPNKCMGNNFYKICEILKGYYKAFVLIVVKVYKFHQGRQEVGESVSMNANRLHRLSANCQFNSFFDTCIKKEIRNGNLSKKLLSQDKKFQECLNIAIVDEAVRQGK